MKVSHQSMLLGRVALAALTIAVALPRRAHADEQTVKLIQLLIDKGILSKGQAADLLRETSAPGKKHTAQASVAAAEEIPAASEPGEVRVTYVPNFVRRQIADQVRADVMAQAREEGWAEPDALPEWTKRVRVYGDIRLRAEGDYYDKGNGVGFINFPAINAGSPASFISPSNQTATSGTGLTQPLPSYDSTENRNRFRARVRIGVDAEIDDWLSADMRLSTGDQGPVSTNQTMGSSGDFNKYAIFLDRASLTAAPVKNLKMIFGRMDNPFFTTDLIYHNDLGFDGMAVKYAHGIGDRFGAFVTAGAFPVFNTALDFSTNSVTKYPSLNAYLYAAQAGVEWHSDRPYAAKLAVGLFDFDGVQGKVSQPCTQAGTSFYCSTDNQRPLWGQGGNTYMALRDLVQSSVGQTQQEYYGLASRFEVLDVHPRFEVLKFHPIDIVLEGEFLKNLGFDYNSIANRGPIIQPGPANNTFGADNHFVGGNTGYMLKVAAGHQKLSEKWDWQSYIAYKYLESDATLDALNDSDFHQGGTNAKGYIIGGGVGIARNTSVTVKFTSASAVSGAPYNVDILQLDLNAAF
jgi:hypothetical protein